MSTVVYILAILFISARLHCTVVDAISFVIDDPSHIHTSFAIEVEHGDNVAEKFEEFREYFISEELYRQYMDTVSLHVYSRNMYTPTIPGTGMEEVFLRNEDIVLYLVAKFHYKRYLEIGTANDITFGPVSAAVPVAVGVDPVAGGTHRMTSNDFFDDNTQIFDIVLIEGDFSPKQVLRDVMNALRFLADDGMIVMCASNPRSEIEQRVPRDFSHMVWVGQVWRVVSFLRIREDLDYVTIDAKHGMTVIRRRFHGPRQDIDIEKELLLSLLSDSDGGQGTSRGVLDALTLDEFFSVKEKLLNLVSMEGFRQWADLDV